MNEEEIRPSSLMIQKDVSLKNDIDYLHRHSNQWIRVPCPACQSSHSKFFGSKHNFIFEECLLCQTVYTNPRPSESLLSDFYRTSENYTFWNEYIFPLTAQTRKEKIFKPRVARVQKEVEKLGLLKPSVLEIGAGFGWFCEELIDSGQFGEVIAIEPSESLAQTLTSKGISTLNSLYEDVELNEKVDIVAAFEVIEHLFNPRDFLNKVIGFLKPNGVLFLSCPNLLGLDLKILKLDSDTFQHEHLNYFHPTSLQNLLKTSGFESVEISTPGELDIDIIKQSYLNKGLNLSDYKFLLDLFSKNDDSLESSFQDFISRLGFSSHMWIVARKTT